MADKTKKLERRIRSIPGFDWKDLVGMGVSWFVTRQKPEEVTFSKHPNGWKVTVMTDEESAQTAKEFWEEHIEERL